MDQPPMMPAQGILERTGWLRLLALAVGIIICGLLLASGPTLLACTRITPAELAVLMSRAHRMHVALLWSSGAVAAVVFSLMLYSTGAFRRSNGTATRSRITEILWTLVPVLIVIGMATPAMRTFAAKVEPVAQAQHLAPGYRCQLGPG